MEDSRKPEQDPAAGLRLFYARGLNFHCPKAKKRIFDFLFAPTKNVEDGGDGGGGGGGGKAAVASEAAEQQREVVKTPRLRIETLSGNVLIPGGLPVLPDGLVLNLKRRIAAKCPEFPAELMVLFYSPADSAELMEAEDYAFMDPSGKPQRLSFILAQTDTVFVALPKRHKMKVSASRVFICCCSLRFFWNDECRSRVVLLTSCLCCGIGSWLTSFPYVLLTHLLLVGVLVG